MLNYLFISVIIGLFLYFLRKYYNGPKTPYSANMEGKIVIITGANVGIGKETALDLLEKGAEVIFACRDENKTMPVLESIQNDNLKKRSHFIKLDISSFDSINSFVNEFNSKFSKLDILINNAGMASDTFSKKNGIETTIMTNHVGPVYLTCLLLNKLTPYARIINVSSGGSKRSTNQILDEFFSDPDFTKLNNEFEYTLLRQYCLSKLGNVYHARQLAEYFNKKNLNIKTASLHPGLVNTDIFSSYRFNTTIGKLYLFLFIKPILLFFSKDLRMGIQTTLHCIYMKYEELTSGGFYNHCKLEKFKRIPADPQLMKKFMNFTKDLLYKNLTNVPEEVKEYFEIASK